MKTYQLKLKHSEGEFVLERGLHYGNGTLAVRAYGPNGPETLSINLEAYGLIPGERQFYAKNYAEHEGLPDALVDAGIATKGPEVHFSHGKGNLMTLLPDVEV